MKKNRVQDELFKMKQLPRELEQPFIKYVQSGAGHLLVMDSLIWIPAWNVII